jgi:hypothetical protein
MPRRPLFSQMCVGLTRLGQDVALTTDGNSWSLETADGIAEERDRVLTLRLVRDAGCQRGACWGCLSQTGVVGRVWPSHCRDSFIASQEVFFLGRPSNRPVQESWSEWLVKLNGGPLPSPLGHPAALTKSAQKHGTPPVAGKQVGTQTCRCVGA